MLYFKPATPAAFNPFTTPSLYILLRPLPTSSNAFLPVSTTPALPTLISFLPAADFAASSCLAKGLNPLNAPSNTSLLDRYIIGKFANAVNKPEDLDPVCIKSYCS